MKIISRTSKVSPFQWYPALYEIKKKSSRIPLALMSSIFYASVLISRFQDNRDMLFLRYYFVIKYYFRARPKSVRKIEFQMVKKN